MIKDEKKLALELVESETENEVINVLKKYNVWDNFDYWRPFGDNENNFSTIGNQQSNADTSLVEKIINSVDAVLMKECMIRGVEPSSPKAPQSMNEALDEYFKIKEGRIAYLSTSQRNSLSNNIILAATGGKQKVNLILADKGEGQTPNEMPNTILSISKNNKLKVPFVQGKFNMGGTGVLPFCGENHFQLVISKRCPDIPNFKNDSSFDEWAFTIVRREEPREGRKSSMFTYLTDIEGNVLRFKADSLPIIPKPNKENEIMQYGTFFKFYNYALQSYKTAIILNLNYRLSMLMPALAHPVRLRECRNFTAHTLETTLSGLDTRLSDDRENNLEDGFPDSSIFHIDGQKFECSLYVFKKGKATNYRKKDGVLFIVNGQTHAIQSDSIFNKAKLPYLQDSILILLDCSNIDISHKEDLFMNSRDRLRKGDLSKALEEKIIEILREHPSLKKLQNERREAAVKDKLNDDKPLQDVLQNIFSKSPILSKILLSGAKINNPFNDSGVIGEQENFKGKFHPSFFTLKAKKGQYLSKNVPINKKFRIQFETDVDNDYFTRTKEKAQFNIYYENKNCNGLISSLNLFNGIATLTLSLPEDKKIGDVYKFHTEIQDDYITPTFDNYFEITILPEEQNNSGGQGGRTKPKDPNVSGNRQNPSGLAMPSITEVEKADWENYGMGPESALLIKEIDDGSDYFLNMDNKYYLTEIKGIRDKEKMDLAKARYKYSMTLIGMSVESYCKNSKENINIEEEVGKVTKMIAPILIPMIDAMSNLDLEEN